MNNSNYNSLSDMLKQSGIISDNDVGGSDDNFFQKKSGNDIEPDYVEIPENFKKEEKKVSRKRLNQYDLELIQNSRTVPKQDNNTELAKRFLNFKKNRTSRGKNGFFEYLFYKFFPKIYAAKLIKQAMEKFKELNIDAKNLLDKTIPYGENDMRYKELVKYISCASEMQTKLKGKFN